MTLLTDRPGAAARRPPAGLEYLIHPLTSEEFQRDYWEQKPLLLRRDDPKYFTDLLSLADVDKVLSLSSIRADGLRVVLDGRETPISQLAGGDDVHDSNALEKLYEKYRSGSTVVLNSLQQRWEPLQRLTSTLGAEISARCAVNVYVTPAGNQGFAPHYDTHDVFVAQTHGTKRWRLHGVDAPLPLKSNPFDHDRKITADPEQEFDLRPGDLLYLPRGTIHSAVANETVSVHLTIGVHPVLWANVIEQAVKKVFEENVEYRKSLPMGFLRTSDGRARVEQTLARLTDDLHKQLSTVGMADLAVSRATSIAHPILQGHLLDLERLSEIGPHTRVAVRPATRWNVRNEADAVLIDFHDKTVRFPAHVAEEVAYLSEHAEKGVSGEEIPGNLDAAGRTVLISTLVREGLLTLA